MDCLNKIKNVVPIFWTVSTPISSSKISATSWIFFIGVLQKSHLDQFTGIKSLTDAGFDLVVESIFSDLDDGFEGVCLAVEEGTLFEVNDIISLKEFLFILSEVVTDVEQKSFGLHD